MALAFPLNVSDDGIDENSPRSRIAFYAKVVEPVDFGGNAEQLFTGINWSEAAGQLRDAILPTPIETENKIEGAEEVTAAKDQLKSLDGAKNFATSTKGDFGLNSSRITRITKTGKEDECVFLYTPQGIQIDDRFSYNNAELGISGAAAFKGAQSMNNLGGAAYAALGSAAAGVSDFKDMITGQGNLSQLAAVRASQGIFGLNPLPDRVTNAIGLAAQVTVNPNLRTLFKGVQVRSFNFNFQFIPTNPQESKAIEEIVTFFRYYSHPGRNEKMGTFGYEFPERFEVRVEHYNGSEWINIEPRFFESYLTNVSVTYNPTASIYFDDGKPTQTNMTLSFMEYRAWDKADFKYTGKDGSSKVKQENAFGPYKDGYAFGEPGGATGITGSGGNGQGDTKNPGIAVELFPGNLEI